MDAAIASAVQAKQADLGSQIQFAVARQALDMAKLQGEGMVQLIETAAQLGKAVDAGVNFDALG